MNNGCSNEDWAGADPIQLATRGAATEPFTDFEVTPLRSLGITRSYSSADVLGASSSAGVFGIGWHHNWEATLTCSGNGANCTIGSGLAPTMEFAAATGTFVGVEPYQGESLKLYQRTESEALAFGGHNLMIRRPNGEFIVFQLDGSELHFAQPASGGCPFCMDGSFNGKLHLTSDVDPVGRVIQLDFMAPGKLITLTDDLGNMLSLVPSQACSGRAGTLAYRAGSDGADATYITYEYDSSCQLLDRVVPANYVPAPNHVAQLRAYDYQSTPVPGLLTRVWNEFNDPVVVVGYNNSSGDVTTLVDDESSLTVSYPEPTQETVVSAYSGGAASTSRDRGNAGKAFNVSTSSPSDFDSSRKLTWNGRYLVCSQDEASRVRYFGRDEHNRVTFLADYGSTCAGTPWVSTTTPPLRARHFEYKLSKPIALGVALSLSIVTKQFQKSVFADRLAQAAGNGTSSDAFQTAEIFDHDPASKSGDPAGYSCGTASLPVGGLVCRKILEGYTLDDSGLPALQRIATFYSYDTRGRLVRSVGPMYLVGQTSTANVDPVEERTYWPDQDADPARRGRLHEIKTWPSGWPSAGSALTTSFELYDAFGPTQVVDPAGGFTILTRVGGAGRVTRVDTPDGRHVSTRYYDGDQPRLLLFNGGSTRRLTYDDKGRLHAIEPLSGDPEIAGASVSSGWLETRDHDSAGNTTRVTRADAQGVLRWKQQFTYYANGALKDIIHPESGNGYARWKRDGTGAAWEFWDEDNYVTSFHRDRLGRADALDFGLADVPVDGVSWHTVGGGILYEYEPDQDTLTGVWRTGVVPLNRIAAYVHDDFGQLLSVNAPSTMTKGPYTYAYDARGNVVRRSGGGSLISYQYDGMDRLTRLTAARTLDGSTFQYVYSYDDPSARGHLRSITEPDRTTTFTYDEVGRIRFEMVAEAGTATMLTTEYRYDLDGDLSEVITPGGLDVKYERDPVTKDITEVRNVTSGTKYARQVQHLPAGPVTALTYAGGSTLAQGFNLRYEPYAIASGPVALSYTMTPTGHVKSIGSTTYGYDVRGRLASATPSTGATPYSYTFAAGSDRVEEQWTVEAVPKRKFAFGYDEEANLSAIEQYDATGTAITGTTCLIHDALGRLTAAGPARVWGAPDWECRTEDDLLSVAVRFRYDARNRRVGRQDGTGPWKQWAFTPDGDPLTELRKPATSGGAWTIEREYVWLDGRPLAQVEYPGPGGGSEGYVYLVHVDHLGQPRALTSTSGAMVWSASPARPLGDIVEATAPDPANNRTIVTNLRLPGQYDERLLGSIGIQGPYYNWNRWYLPGMGRYLELDPIALVGGFNGEFGPDWYGYAKQNPLRWGDPMGLAPPYAWLVRLLSNGERRLIRPLADKAAAVAARKAEGNVLFESRQAAKAAEKAANGGCGETLRHGGHPLPNGEIGNPHYQTEGMPGHSFWGDAADILDLFLPPIFMAAPEEV